MSGVNHYALLRLKQSKHFRLLVSRGAKGSEVIAPPQLAQVHLPANLGFSVEAGMAEPPKSSAGAGPSASSAKSGISGASEAADISGGASTVSRLLLFP